ncbi:19777_t:CDS:2 [Funneliformis geosporum]|nr:19777_t:CDS:2 [Funneliformis geosporum]
MISSIEEDEKQPKSASHVTEISAKFADDSEKQDNSITDSEEASEMQTKPLISAEDYEDVYFDNDPIPHEIEHSESSDLSEPPEPENCTICLDEVN